MPHVASDDSWTVQYRRGDDRAGPVRDVALVPGNAADRRLPDINRLRHDALQQGKNGFFDLQFLHWIGHHDPMKQGALKRVHPRVGWAVGESKHLRGVGGRRVVGRTMSRTTDSATRYQ